MRKLFIILVTICFLTGCATTYTVTVQRGTDGKISGISSNADAAWVEGVGYKNHVDGWTAFWGGVGGWVGRNTGFYGHYGWINYDDYPNGGDIITTSQGGNASATSKATAVSKSKAKYVHDGEVWVLK